MVDKLQVKLYILGEPFVETFDGHEAAGKRVRLPLRKAEAALFYLFFEGRVPRETLKLLFWGDKDEEQASSNLRNALYLLRRALPNHFVSEGRVLSLLRVSSDLELISALADPDVPIDHAVYEEPMRGFDGIGSPEFDEWLVLTRAAVAGRTAEALRSRIAACYERELREELTDALNALLFFEPFDEGSLLELMEAYTESGHTAKAVSLFNEYSGRALAELGIQPSERALDFYAKITGAHSTPGTRAGMLQGGSEGDAGCALSGLPEAQRDLLSVLSLFDGGATLELAASVLGVPEGSLVEEAAQLMRSGTIAEREHGGDYRIVFADPALAAAIYEAIPHFKRRDLHALVAAQLNRRYSPQVWDPGLNADLRRHYGRAGLKAEELRQHLREMGLDITLNHILFPLLQDRVLVSCRRPFGGREETECRIRQIQDLLVQLNESPAIGEGEYAGMEAQYLEIWGGYLVNWGEYRLGRTMLERALRIARDRGFDETQLYCLEHFGHYYLQTDAADRLRRTGREIVRIAHERGRDEHKGLALRFIGMSRMLERDFEVAERVFLRSSQVFEDLALTGRHYTLGILAPRCYIGEIRQWRGETDAAMERFTHCIEQCSKAGLFWGLSHFHAHAADTALDMGDRGLAARHIDDGVALFESSEGGHCGSLLYSLKAMLDAERGDEEGAIAALRKGDFLCAIGKRSWRAAQAMAYAWVARLAEGGDLTGESLRGGFAERSEAYARVSADLYEEIGATQRANCVRRSFGLN